MDGRKVSLFLASIHFSHAAISMLDQMDKFAVYVFFPYESMRRLNPSEIDIVEMLVIP